MSGLSQSGGMTTGLIESVVAEAVSVLIKRGLSRVREPAQQKALRRVLEAAIRTAVERTLGYEDARHIDHIVGLWGEFLSAPAVVDRILETGAWRSHSGGSRDG